MSRTVAIIPARGGSKGIPRKNIRIFCGKPLVAYSIIAGREARLVDEVYVSTDDREIADIARRFGAQIIERPSEFASDTASTFSVLRHASEVLDFPDIVVTLQPTSPLRTAKHIDEAISLLEDDVETVIAVCSMHRYYWYTKNGYGVPDFDARLRRQDMRERFVENGYIYVTRKSVLLRNDSRLGMGITSAGKVKLYKMKDFYSVELDSELDFIILEEAYKYREGGKGKNV